MEPIPLNVLNNAAPAPAPAPVDNDELLIDYLTSDLPLHGIARKHHLTLDQLAAWARDPRTLARIQTLREISAERTACAAAHARTTAVIVLEELLTSRDGSADTLRRAATTLLRVCSDKSPLPHSHRSNCDAARSALSPVTDGRDVEARRDREGNPHSAPHPVREWLSRGALPPHPKPPRRRPARTIAKATAQTLQLHAGAPVPLSSEPNGPASLRALRVLRGENSPPPDTQVNHLSSIHHFAAHPPGPPPS